MFSLFSFSNTFSFARSLFSFFFALVCLHSFNAPHSAFAFDSITFSRVQQCGNFTVQFAGGQPPTALPLTLVVVPFNLTPILFQVPNSNWNDTTLTGAAITFLPFPAGTDFVAALIDADGADAGPVSSIITVDDSADDDADKSRTACLAAENNAPGAERYSVSGAVSQCAPFDVVYNASAVSAPPAIRAFVPGNASTIVNAAPGGQAGCAKYLMDVPAGQEVVLTFMDNSGYHQATGPLLVQGDEQSPRDCLRQDDESAPVGSNNMSMGMSMNVNMTNGPERNGTDTDTDQGSDNDDDDGPNRRTPLSK